MKLRLLVLFVVFAGCAGAVKTARTYSARGMHEFAVAYYAANYLQHPKDRKAKALLKLEAQRTFRRMDMDYRQAMDRGRFEKAADLALREDALARSLQGLSLTGVDANYAAGRLSMALKALNKKALAMVDRAEVRQLPIKKRLRLLRKARAINPANPDLDERYERLRRMAMHYVRVGCVNETGVQGLCQLAKGRLESAICGVDREFITLVTEPNDPRVNTEIAIRVTGVRTGDSMWRQQEKGVLKAKVQRLNRFREPVIRDGEIVYQVVTAFYQIFQRITYVHVDMNVRVLDLEHGNRVLYARHLQAQKTSSRRFYRWSGDERAVAAYPKFIGMSTGQYPPTPPLKMVFPATQTAIGRGIGAIIDLLEYR